MNEAMAITGLHFERFPHTETDPVKFLIMATTPTRIYQFIGGPTFEAVFASYETNAGFQELPGALNHSELRFFSQSYKGFSLSKSFAWLTGNFSSYPKKD